MSQQASNNKGMFYSTSTFTSEGPEGYGTMQSGSANIFRGGRREGYNFTNCYIGDSAPTEAQIARHQATIDNRPLEQFFNNAHGAPNVLLDQVGTAPTYPNAYGFQPVYSQPQLAYGSQSGYSQPQLTYGSQPGYPPQQLGYPPCGNENQYQSGQYGSVNPSYGSQHFGYPPNVTGNQDCSSNPGSFPPAQQQAPRGQAPNGQGSNGQSSNGQGHNGQGHYGSVQYGPGPVPPTPAPMFLSTQVLPRGQPSNDQPPAYEF